MGLLEEYLIYGGYPEVVLIPNKQEKLLKLDSIANAYIAINAGTQFNLSSARETIGISSVTLSKYLNLLEETFIIAELPPFFTNRNKEIRSIRKIYFKDTGINNLLLQNFNSLALRRDAGALYETYVFNTYFKTPKPQNLALVMFKEQVPWGDKPSITFVITLALGNSIYIYKLKQILRLILYKFQTNKDYYK
ncbi:hypothetical protein PN36_19715 [Candidatus Thiomargarita nelsonii]|uniref:DUF4143 domain-containing protein n=1 Tax=Candidatus Thiomargarita nelsonii TaxID=1003181 RepID=A0A0A6P2W4_9GAMM|nr:hypothetical protein PN36_19715 [Candidatus Thiomargarita nelsonii]